MKTLAILLASFAIVSAQQIGKTTTTTVTNTTTRPVTLRVTTTRVVARSSTPVVVNGKTNVLTDDKLISELVVTNAPSAVIERLDRPHGPHGRTNVVHATK